MNTKKKYVWKLYSGASWYLREAAEYFGFGCLLLAVGTVLGCLVNVG